MKHNFVLFFMMIFWNGYAQNYVDLLHTEYTSTPKNNFEDQSTSTDSNTSRLTKTHINLTVPIRLKNKNTLITGLVFDRIDTRFFTNSPTTPVSSFYSKQA